MRRGVADTLHMFNTMTNAAIYHLTILPSNSAGFIDAKWWGVCVHWSSATFAAAAGDDGDDAGGCASTASAASAAPAAPLSHGGASAAFAAGLMIMVRGGVGGAVAVFRL